MRHTNFLIVHGTLGNPESNWFPWLKRELEKEGQTVIVPRFPTPEGQTLSSWLDVAEKVVKGLDPADTVLIGHSLGAIFLLRLAEKAQKPFQAAFLVCPFMRKIGVEPYDTLNATFIQPPLDWPRIRKNAPRIHAFAGQDDPYVPLPYASEVAEQSGATLTVIDKGGHLNAESGYREFPLLLEKIRQTILPHVANYALS
ncbi:MAG: alpha/beta fold hydrolase [Alphaproteobacteria bacterium]|nr:alpha/beta fold hydrolase [Alphaproteobacteria bacterium]